MLRICLLLLSVFAALPAPVQGQERLGAIPVSALPAEARETLALIRKGGPFPYRKDGAVFGNFEKRLPSQPRGYYREYTVPTPGLRNRGARRIIAGRNATQGARALHHAEYYYTEDHYRSFLRIQE